MKTTLALSFVATLLLTGCQSPPVPSNHFQGTIDGVPFQLDTKKQTKMKGFEFLVSRVSPIGTNFATLKIESIEGVNDPQVISKSYAGQAAVAKEFFDGFNSLASKLAEGGTKGAIEGISPKP
jgi:hypothetical protein